MTDATKALVRSLLQRWDADRQRLAGLISPAERDAILALLNEFDPPAANSSEAAAPSVTPSIEINQAALGRDRVEDPDIVLCFDLGTARSKAFAAAAADDDDDDVELIEIPLGDLDNDVDGSVYAVSSSVWIDEKGLTFVGSEAIRRSQSAVYQGAARARIDSLKHLVSLAASEELVTQHLLAKAENPTNVTLTLDHVLVLFLAYLTDLATSHLQDQGRGRYVRRRFSLPCWAPEHRKWSTPYLATRLAAAQIVADTFSGQWTKGIPAAIVKDCASKAIDTVEAARYLVDHSPDLPAHLSKHWGGILEPLAAGSTRVWKGKNSKEAVLVMDVGAGTTDLSLFWVAQLLRDHAHPGHRAFPITPQSHAIRVAGDHLDHILVAELLKRAHLDGVEGERKQAEAALRLSGIRRLKEELFKAKSLRHKMSNDLIVEISLDEFLELPAVRKFERALEESVRSFLERVHSSWSHVESLQLVLTGGGSELPMVTRLAGMSLPIGDGKTVRLRPGERVPAFLSAYSDALSKEYPQLAVAMGGALPLVLDERTPMTEYPGDAPRIGALERFQTQGI
jgi:molecular chaperone HscA